MILKDDVGMGYLSGGYGYDASNGCGYGDGDDGGHGSMCGGWLTGGGRGSGWGDNGGGGQAQTSPMVTV